MALIIIFPKITVAAVVKVVVNSLRRPPMKKEYALIKKKIVRANIL